MSQTTGTNTAPGISKTTGAILFTKLLRQSGIRRVFSLSSNQIMALYDTFIDAQIEIVHVRHEAAAVHMADGWARTTGEPGMALVTAGPGHANSVSALYTAKCCESPLVILSGHAPVLNNREGHFQ